jgi:hypothetical protein
LLLSRFCLFLGIQRLTCKVPGCGPLCSSCLELTGLLG